MGATRMLDRAIALFGTTQPMPERIELTAGPVSATLENGALRWIRYDGIEVLRGIAFLVRDRNWRHRRPQIIRSERCEQTEAASG